jgi:hypothetical protein
MFQKILDVRKRRDCLKHTNKPSAAEKDEWIINS